MENDVRADPKQIIFKILRMNLEAALPRRRGVSREVRETTVTACRGIIAAIRWLDCVDEECVGGVPVGAYGPVLAESFDPEEVPDMVGYYDNEDSCEECGSPLAVLLTREGGDVSVPWNRLKPCPRKLWKLVGFDPTLSLLGEDQEPGKGEVS